MPLSTAEQQQATIKIIKKPQQLRHSEAALTAIDPDWNPAWPVTWQRHYAAVRELLAEEDTALTELLPGVTVHGMDVGKWLARQREHTVWQALLPQQRETPGTARHHGAARA